MKIAKNAVAAMAAAALAASMVCAAPATMAQAAPAQPAAAEAGSTYTTMAKAKKATMKVGTKATLKVTGGKVISWKSSKKSVVSVNKKGVATAKKVGKATITAKTKKGSSTFVITVVDPAEQALASLAQTIMDEGVAQPAEDALDENDFDYVLPLSDDGNVCAVFNYENYGLRFVDTSVPGYEFRIVMDVEPGKIANFLIRLDGVDYWATVPLATYAFDDLEWWTEDGTTISEAKQEAFSQKAATAYVYNIAKSLNDRLDIQLNDLGFYSLKSL